MTPSEKSALIAAITALLAVILGPLVTVWVTQRQSRIALRSQNRQAWINSLRDCIAEYVSLASVGLTHSSQKDLQARAKELMLLESKILLMLNPKEEDHQRLILLLVECRAAIAKSIRSQPASDTDDVFLHLNKVIPLSQTILKREWERVKRAE